MTPTETFDPTPETPKHREEWPTTGFAGAPSPETLAEYQRHDPTGRPWVQLTYWPDNHTDRTEEFFGPVTEETALAIRVDLGHRHPTAFLKRFAVIKRVQS